MISQSTIEQSNASLTSTSLTAVFVGGTSGIGLYTLQSLAHHILYPTIYIIGRSHSAAQKILSDLQTINPKGKYTFLPGDVAYMSTVDTLCNKIRAQESSINLLVLSQGTMLTGTETNEGLHVAASLLLHSRMRFTLNLLPLLNAAATSSLSSSSSCSSSSGIARVLSIFAGTKEGPLLSSTDLQLRHLRNPLKGRGHAASALTLLMEEAQRRAPMVSFVHSFPGPVRSNISRGDGWMLSAMRGIYAVVGRWVFIPERVSGERHLFLGTNGRFLAAEGGGEDGEGEVEGKGGVSVAMGTDGEVGSGVYCVDEVCESGGEEVLGILRKAREDGKGEWVWEEVKGDFLGITGRECL